MTESNQPLELLTVSEAARRLRCVRNTLARQIERHNVTADALLIEGSRHLRSPLFVVERLKELGRLVGSEAQR